MVVLALAVGAFAQTTINFDLNEERLAELGFDGSVLEEGLVADVRDQLQLDGLRQVLDAFAHAAAMSAKGMGVDYASNADKFVIGAAMGAAVSGQPLTFTRGESEIPHSGYAFMTAIQAGVNLGAFDGGYPNVLDRIRLYANGLGLRTPSEHALKGRFANIGLHGQFEIVTPKPMGKLAEWGGIAVTTGFEHVAYELELSGVLPLSSQTAGGNLTWEASGAYIIKSSATTVPIELSTNIRFVPLTAYTGVGWDFDIAQASTNAALSGQVTVSADGTTEEVGGGTVSFDEAGEGLPYQIRGFFGAQIAISAFKLFGQLNFAADRTYGAYAGVRVAM